MIELIQQQVKKLVSFLTKNYCMGAFARLDIVTFRDLLNSGKINYVSAGFTKLIITIESVKLEYNIYPVSIVFLLTPKW
jgi:hypothetical protein